jgi:hypothetical protein
MRLVQPEVVRFRPDILLLYINSSALLTAVWTESPWFISVAPTEIVIRTLSFSAGMPDSAISMRHLSAKAVNAGA